MGTDLCKNHIFETQTGEVSELSDREQGTNRKITGKQGKFESLGGSPKCI